MTGRKKLKADDAGPGLESPVLRCRVEGVDGLKLDELKSRLKTARIFARNVVLHTPVDGYSSTGAASFELLANDRAGAARVTALTALGTLSGVSGSVEGSEGWQDHWTPGRNRDERVREQTATLKRAQALGPTDGVPPKERRLRTEEAERAEPGMFNVTGDWSDATSKRTTSRAVPRLGHLSQQPDILQIIRQIEKRFNKCIVDERALAREAGEKGLSLEDPTHVRALLETTLAGGAVDCAVGMLAFRTMWRYLDPQFRDWVFSSSRECHSQHLVQSAKQCRMDLSNAVALGLRILLGWTGFGKEVFMVAKGAGPADATKAQSHAFVCRLASCLDLCRFAAVEKKPISASEILRWTEDFEIGGNGGPMGFVKKCLGHLSALRPFDGHSVRSMLTGPKICACGQQFPVLDDGGGDVLKLPFAASLREALLELQAERVRGVQCSGCGAERRGLHRRLLGSRDALLLDVAPPADLKTQPCVVPPSFHLLLHGMPYFAEEDSDATWHVKAFVMASRVEFGGQIVAGGVLTFDSVADSWEWCVEGEPPLVLSGQDARKLLDDPSTAALSSDNFGSAEFFRPPPSCSEPDRRSLDCPGPLHIVAVLVEKGARQRRFPPITSGAFRLQFPDLRALDGNAGSQGSIFQMESELVVKKFNEFMDPSAYAEVESLVASGRERGLVRVLSIHVDPADERPSFAYTMRLFENKSATNFLFDGDARPLSAILKIFVGATEGLLAMSRRGYGHADVKMDNIFVDANGNGSLGDAGCVLALKWDGWALLSKFVGTPGCTAPELRTPAFFAQGQPPPLALYTRASDVWAMAAALFCGVTCFHAYDSPEVRGDGMHADWERNSLADKLCLDRDGWDEVVGLGQEQAAVVVAALSSDPTKRPSTFALLVALRELFDASRGL